MRLAPHSVESDGAARRSSLCGGCGGCGAGHDPAIFLRKYAHLYPGDLAAVANAMDLLRVDATVGDGTLRSRPTVLQPTVLHGARGNAGTNGRLKKGAAQLGRSPGILVEAMGLEPTNLLTASQALYQLSYAPSGEGQT
jgi:hypothetical protein